MRYKTAVANEINKDGQGEAALEAAIETTREKKLSSRLAKLRDKVVLELPQAIEQRETEQNWFENTFASIFSDGPITADELAELQTLSASIDIAYQKAITSFETETAEFEQEAAAAGNALSADVKQLIQSRHAEALQHIKNRYAQTQAQLTALINAQSASAQEQALEQLNQSLEQEQFKPTHTPATPDNLPWSAPDEEVREPVDNPQDLQAALGLNPYAKYAQLAQAGDTDPGLIAQAMANAANTELQAALAESIEVQLTPEIEVQLATLTKHNLVGDLLYGTVFNYFALNDLQDQIAAHSSNVLSYRLPSYGTFSTNLKTQYWYGLPRNVTFSGLSMDIDHMKQHRVSKTNNKDESVAFSQSIGARMSAMEHLVPEQMFSTETEKAQGISAVKALEIASQAGQKIWTIDKNNVNLALGRINLGADAENDIRNAVNAGKIATAHETRINFNGWIGEGYTLLDPNTGAGAYMISGGGNGSELAGDVSEIIGFAALFVEILDKSTGDNTIQKQAFKFILGAVAKLFSGFRRFSS